MPVSPSLAENLAQEVVGLYQEAERTLLARISKNLASGISGPHWAEQKYAQLLAYQRQTEQLIADLKAKSEHGVTTAITDAYERGGLSAVQDIARIRGGDIVASKAAEKALEGKWWPSPDNQFRWAIVRNGEVETVFASKEEAQSFASKYMKGQKRTYVRQNFNEMAAVADAAKQAAAVTPAEPLAGLRAVEAMAQETLGYVNATHPRILRSTMDAYRAAIEAGSKQAFVGSMERVAASEAARDIVAENAQQVLLGATTRRQATQEALNAFAKRGITGFVSKSGASNSLESYVETAMRTGCGRAAVQGHVDRLVENGLNLVIVSDAPRECPLCRPWEGKVLSIGGSYAGAVDGDFLAEGQTTYPTLDEARAARFQHVNCRHSVSAYQPGVTRPMGDTADPEGYAATEKLRYLERNVRQSKRMEAAAGIDPAALAKATRRKLDYQAKIRELVATTTAKRQPYRESLGVSKAQLEKLTPKP